MQLKEDLNVKFTSVYLIYCSLNVRSENTVFVIPSFLFTLSINLVLYLHWTDFFGFDEWSFYRNLLTFHTLYFIIYKYCHRQAFNLSKVKVIVSYLKMIFCFIDLKWNVFFPTPWWVFFLPLGWFFSYPLVGFYVLVVCFWNSCLSLFLDLHCNTKECLRYKKSLFLDL